MTGSVAWVLSLPISRWAMQWFTPISGFLRRIERLLANAAPIFSVFPMPGLMENAMRSICFGWMLASLRDCWKRASIDWRWCSATSTGRIPPWVVE